jgi:hypothetical protein
VQKELLTLYGTSACHICEDAWALCEAVLNPLFFDVQWVDISHSDDLIERYGTRIPVLQRMADGSELGWPFEIEQIIDFLSLPL